MSFKIVVYLIFFLFVKHPQSAESEAMNHESQNFIFQTNLTQCAMFAKNCFINFLLVDSKQIRNLQVKSSDQYLAKVKSIESCSNRTNYQKCATIDQFDQLSSKEKINFEKNIFVVVLEPMLVGKVEIKFDLNGRSDSDVHAVVVTQPKRFIDLFQQIYTVIFSLSTALLMGLLLDISKLKKILVMPLPVIIGFISQYLFMPLLAFGFIVAFKMNPAESLALFIYGCRFRVIICIFMNLFKLI